MVEAVLEDDLVEVWIFLVEGQEKHRVFEVKVYAKRLVFAQEEDLEELKFVALVDAQKISHLRFGYRDTAAIWLLVFLQTRRFRVVVRSKFL